VGTLQDASEHLLSVLRPKEDMGVGDGLDGGQSPGSSLKAAVIVEHPQKYLRLYSSQRTGSMGNKQLLPVSGLAGLDLSLLDTLLAQTDTTGGSLIGSRIQSITV